MPSTGAAGTIALHHLTIPSEGGSPLIIEGPQALTSREPLKNPPIHEAVLDVRVLASSDVSAASFEPLIREIAGEFPQSKRMNAFAAEFAFGKGAPTTRRAERKPLGHLFESVDKKHILQFRVDGFTLSRLRPYEGFDGLYSLFERYWQMYLECAKPRGVVRLATRYINRFDVPPAGTIEDHLTVFPSPPLAALSVTQFVHRTQYRNLKTNLNAGVVIALEPALDGKASTIVIDIDAYAGGSFECDLQTLGTKFRSLRMFKDDLFFAIVGPRALERFDQ